MPVDETGAPPPAAALETAAPIAASVEAPAFAAVAPEVAVAEVALEAAQTDAHAGIQGLAGAEAQSVDYSKGIDARTADPALMEAFREEVKQANASGEDRPYADMLAKAQARAAEAVDSDVAEEATQATSPATEAAEPAAETEEKTTKGYFELNAKDGGMGISDRAPNADAYRQVMQEMQTNGTVLTQAEIRDRVNQIVTGQVPEGAISGVGEEAVVTDLAEEPAAEASAGEPAAEPAIETVVDAAEGAAAETKTAEGAVAEEPAPEAPADAATEAPAEVVEEAVAVDAASKEDSDTNKVDEKAALRAQTLWLSDFDAAEGTDAEKEAIADQKARERQSKPVTEEPGEAIEELRDDLARLGGFDAVEPARTDPSGTREADEEAPESTDKPPEEEHAGDYLAYQDPRGGYIGIPANSADYAIYKSVIDEANQNGETPSVEEIQGRVRALREAAEDTAAEGVSLAEPATGEANVAAASAEPTVVADEAAAVVAPDSAAVVEPTVTGSPEATPDPNKPPIRVDSQGRRFADNGPGKNQPEYRSFQQAHAELITSGKPFTETDVRNRATELRTQELTEEQEKLQAAKKNESAPPPPNAPGGPETGTNRPSPQAERAASLAKIDEQLKDKNLSATERAALMAQKQELRKDPDAEVKKLKEKFDKGEDLSEDEIRQVAEFDTREAQASPVEAAPTVPELSDSEKLDALYQELTNYGTEAMNKMMNGEDPTELVVQFQEKFLEANKLTQSVAQKEQNRAFMEGVFKKDLAKKLNPEQSQRQKNISEKLQELTQLQLQLTAAKETIKTYKQSEKHQQGAVNSAARNLGTGNEKEQLKYQMEYNAAVMGLTNTQEMIRKQVNIGRELKAKRMSAVNYIHRKTGVGSPLGNMLGFMAAGAYGMYAEARYDIDVDI